MSETNGRVHRLPRGDARCGLSAAQLYDARPRARMGVVASAPRRRHRGDRQEVPVTRRKPALTRLTALEDERSSSCLQGLLTALKGET